MSKVRTEPGNCLSLREALLLLEAIASKVETFEIISGDYSYRLEMIRESNSLYLLEKVDREGNVWGRSEGTVEDPCKLLFEVDMEPDSVPAGWISLDTSVE